MLFMILYFYIDIYTIGVGVERRAAADAIGPLPSGT